jgi:hypothetical protein
MALKQKTVQVESLGEGLLLRQLSAKGQISIIEAENQYDGVLIACKYGVVDWADKSVDEIAEMITLEQAGEISTHIFALSEITEKN